MTSKRSVLLMILLTLTTGSGCIRYVKPDIPCPDRPELIPIPVEVQIEMDPDTVRIVAENQLRLKQYAKKLESRAGCDR